MTRRPLRALSRDQGAIVAPMVAAIAASLLAATGVALDIGLYYTDGRELRAATEAAALAAAQAGLSDADINQAAATTKAQTILAKRGYAASVIQTVQPGYYCADASPTLRFKTAACSGTTAFGNSYKNAVRITTTKPSRRFLTGLFGNAVIPNLTATATATRIDEAGLGITSGVLDITTPVVTNIVDLLQQPVNVILGALLNTAPLDLQSRDVEAMMRHDVDAGLFFDSLARQQNFTGTYGELLANGSVPLNKVLIAAADGTSDSLSAAALRKVATSPAASANIDLSGMFGLGVWKNMPVGEANAAPALRAGMNAYQLLTFAVQRVGGKIDLSSISSTLTGTNNTVRVGAVVIDSRAQPNFSFGPAGQTNVATAAARLEVKVGLPDISLLGLAKTTVNVPLILEIAPASATIAHVNGIACPTTAEQARDTRIRVNAQTGLVAAYIGKVSPTVMNRPFAQPITAADVQKEAITKLEVNLLLTKISAGIEGKAAAPNFLQAANGTPVFGPGGTGTIGKPGPGGVAGTPVTISNRSQIGNSVSALLNDLDLSVEASVAGLNLGLNLALLKTQLVQAITSPLTGLIGGLVDPLLDTILGALGIRLGHATVWVTGARCGVPVLV